jgi:hypothetical protein
MCRKSTRSSRSASTPAKKFYMHASN